MSLGNRANNNAIKFYYGFSYTLSSLKYFREILTICKD